MSRSDSNTAIDLVNSQENYSTDIGKRVTIHSGRPRRLRLLSYNIQTGIATSRYRHYLTHSWKHVLPYPQRMDNLDRIAKLIGNYDIVGLQEVDGGSLRSGFINQTEYLALQAHFPYWYDQTNRNLGKLARHSTGFLSRFHPTDVTEVKLPGMIPGRGALVIRFGKGEESLLLLILHLALGKRARQRQLELVSELAHGYRHIIVMGDLNCRSGSDEFNWLLKNAELSEPMHGLHTFPSWRPQRSIDHILVSPTLNVENVHVLNYTFSDHLPIMMEVQLPETINL
jgi:endonuclease/exonuclease/phosphatase family metal-dependent hydrolase